MKRLLDSGIQAEIFGEQLHLLPQKAIYWEREKCLLIADLHLGKGNHFRKNGIPVPASSQQVDWTKLKTLFATEGLLKVIFLGDLFHSSFNEDCVKFEKMIAEYPHLQFDLVAGNHDILDEHLYKRMGMKVHLKPLRISPFILSHEPLENIENEYNLAGHIHPGVQLKGKGKLRQRVACFFFGKNSGLLPAFGSLTGLHTLKVKKDDQVFIPIGDKVVFAQ